MFYMISNATVDDVEVEDLKEQMTVILRQVWMEYEDFGRGQEEHNQSSKAHVGRALLTTLKPPYRFNRAFFERCSLLGDPRMTLLFF